MYKEAGCYSSYILHSDSVGLFDKLEIDQPVREYVIEKNLFVGQGMPVYPYKHSGYALGCLILKFSDARDMLEVMETIHEHVHTRVL
jgi:hypothetical protein